MSHSRIFQLSTEEIDKDEYMDGNMFYEDSFVGNIADYVSDTCNREDDIKWLVECYSKFGLILNQDGTLTFEKGFIAKYFIDRFKTFKEKSQKLTFEQFSGFDTDSDSGSTLWDIQNAINDKWGFYIYNEDYPKSLDDFVRDYLVEDEKYYVGGTVDYHY